MPIDSFESENSALEDSATSAASPAPSSAGGGRLTASAGLYESNSHGGSWVDSFDEDSGIELIYNLNHSKGDVYSCKYKYLPNGNFEKGTLGLVPDGWNYNIYNTGSGSGTHTINCDQINSQYQSVSHSMYGYVKSQANSGSYRTHMNVSMSSFADLYGGKYIYIHMRDIQVSHSLGWGWNTMIYLQFYDGVNKSYSINHAKPWPSILYYNCETIGTTNLYNSTATGMDGQTWYVYKREIPPVIDMSNFNLTITWYSDDWTGSGCYSSISSVVDNIYIETEPKGTLISKPISIPHNMNWDSLILNKTQPLNTFINITILNASNNQPIPGSLTYNNGGEFDISYVDPLLYSSIKLKAEFVRNCSAMPTLHYWGVSWNATNAWRDSLFGGLKVSARHQNLIYGDGETWLKPVITEWYKYSGNPVITVGTGTSWDKDFLSYPNVMFNGTHYYLYYSGGGSDNNIGLATSTDGITWTKCISNPVLSRGPTGSWDAVNVKPNFVTFDGTIYKMYYQGQEITKNDWNTGYATSTDGINWQKYPYNPVFKTSTNPLDWDYHYSNINDIYYDGHIYQAWYTGLAQVGGIAPYQIGYATSFDGINWARYPSNPVLAGPMGWYNGLNVICVLFHNNQYLGWYDYKLGGGVPMKIHFATSTDGVSWSKYAGNPVLQPGPAGTWDNALVGLPEVIIKGKQFWMYYAGNDGSKTQIGLAKSKFEPYAILNSTTITIPTNHKWDTLIFNQTAPTNTSLTLTIIDNTTNLPIMNYTGLTSLIIDLTGLDPLIYPSIRLSAEFKSIDRKDTPILFDWSLNWTYGNIAPIADAGMNQTVFESQKVTFNGTCSYDPDGTIVNWSWDVDDDGVFELFGPVVNFTFNDDSINNVTLMVIDDQGANDTDWTVITVLNLNSTIDNITVSNAYPRTIGYWKHQCKIDTPKGDHTGILPEYITGVNANSSVFNTLSSKYDILDHLEPDDHSNMTQKAKQQLLALWLNVVSGKLGLGTPLNLANLTNASTVGAAISEIEQIILNSSSNRSELERAKDIADTINNGGGTGNGTALNVYLSDQGSDDLNLTIDWGDGSVNTTMIFYNNAPLNTSDPYPSQFTGKAPLNVFAATSHNYSSSGTYLIKIIVQDDDGGKITKIYNIII